MDASKEILRPPQLGTSSPVSTSSAPPLTPEPACVNEEGEDSLKQRVLEQQEEIRGLKSEVKILRRSIKGVHQLGRELQKSKEVNHRLKALPLDDINGHGSTAAQTERLDENGDMTNFNEDDVEVADENVSSASSSSSEGSSDEAEEEEEDNSESEDSTDEDDDKVDDFDGLDDSVESDEEEMKPSTRVKKTRRKAKPHKLQQLLAENTRLRAENKELRAAREAETANAFHYVTSTEANELQRKADTNVDQGKKSSIGLDTESLGWERRYKETEIENGELKATVKEIKNVNHKWDQFWKDKKSENETKLKQRDEEISRLKEVIDKKDEEIKTLKDYQEKERKEHNATIQKMERVLDVETKEKENIQKEKDEMLLLAKERVDTAESKNEQLRREMTKDQQKCERAQKFARNLLKQKKEMEDEIKRLNGTLTEKCEEHSLLKSIDPKMTSEMQLSLAEVNQRRPSPPLSPSHMSDIEQELLVEVTEIKVQDGRQRTPPILRTQESSGMERSLTKDELKEKVALYREQTEAYESDFRRERRDREVVVGQLDSVKKELRETRAKLTGAPKSPINLHRSSSKDKPIHKDPTRHQLPGYMQASQRHVYSNKQDNLIAHGHVTSKPKERSQPKHRRERSEHHYYQPRYFDDWREYDAEIFEDGDEQYQMCRCPKHDCYVPARMKPMNNLSKTNGTC